jgi:hypothetical protein
MTVLASRVARARSASGEHRIAKVGIVLSRQSTAQVLACARVLRVLLADAEVTHALEIIATRATIRQRATALVHFAQAGNITAQVLRVASCGWRLVANTCVARAVLAAGTRVRTRDGIAAVVRRRTTLEAKSSAGCRRHFLARALIAGALFEHSVASIRTTDLLRAVVRRRTARQSGTCRGIRFVADTLTVVTRATGCATATINRLTALVFGRAAHRARARLLDGLGTRAHALGVALLVVRALATVAGASPLRGARLPRGTLGTVALASLRGCIAAFVGFTLARVASTLVARARLLAGARAARDIRRAQRVDDASAFGTRGLTHCAV